MQPTLNLKLITIINKVMNLNSKRRSKSIQFILKKYIRIGFNIGAAMQPNFFFSIPGLHCSRAAKKKSEVDS